MSIAVLYSFPNRIGVSGIGMTAWHQVMGLVREGVEVHLFCGSCERPIPGLASLTQTMRVGGWKIPYRLVGSDIAFSYHDRVVARALRRRGLNIQVIHAWPLGAARTLECAREKNIPTLLERPNAHTAFAYDSVAQEHRRIGLPVPKTHTHAFNPKRLHREELEYAAASKLACPSDFVSKTFLDRGFSPNHIARHQYGYDPAEFAATFPGPVGGPNAKHALTAAFVGRCEPRKGLHHALKAWHDSGAARVGRLFIAGTFIDGYEEHLSPLLDHPSITRLGFVTDTATVMRGADILLLPSIEEGSALVTYEARACGCVLVVSDATGARCTHGLDALVHPAGDVTALSEHLRLLRTAPELLAKLREESLRGVSSLTWTAAAQTLVGIYQELIDGPDKRAPSAPPAAALSTPSAPGG